VRRSLAAALATVTAALLVVIALPAGASAAPLDPDAVSSRMLQKSDVVPVMGLGRPLTKNVYTIEGNAPPLCNQANQRLVQGPSADSNAAVTLDRGQKSGLNQSVYEYGTRAAAVEAFAAVERRAKQCKQTNVLPGSGQKATQLLTFGPAAVQFKGVPGVWTREINSQSRGKVVFDMYSLNLLVGSTIQQYNLAFFDAGRTADVQRSSVDTLALDLAKRWQS